MVETKGGDLPILVNIIFFSILINSSFISVGLTDNLSKSTFFNDEDESKI